MKRSTFSLIFIVLTVFVLSTNHVAAESISGYVLDSLGNPVTSKSFMVQVYYGNPCYVNNTDGPFAFTSQTTGYYQIDNVPPGDFYLIQIDRDIYIDEFWPDANFWNCNAAELLTIQSGQNLTEKNFILKPGAGLSGGIYQSDGTTLISGADSYIEIISGAPCYPPTSVIYSINADGTFAFTDIPPGDYYLKTEINENYIDEYWNSNGSVRDCSQAEPITVSVGQEVTGINFQLDPGATISGTVYDSNGNPIVGEAIYVDAYQGDPCGSHQWYGYGQINSVDGTYTITGMPAGTYFLKTEAYSNRIDEWWADPQSVRDCSQAQPILVSEGQEVTGRNFQLDPGATISGTVYDSNGHPIVGEDMHVDAYQGDPCGSHQWYGYGQINSVDGTYTITRMPAGTYFLKTEAYSNRIDEWWADPQSVSDCSQAEPITISEGQKVTNINFQLDPGGTISGSIFHEGTSNLVTNNWGLFVSAVVGDPCGYYRWINGATGGETGHYTISGLPEGEYYLWESDSLKYYPEWWSSTGSTIDCRKAEKVYVPTLGNITGKDFHLKSTADETALMVPGVQGLQPAEFGKMYQQITFPHIPQNPDVFSTLSSVFGGYNPALWRLYHYEHPNYVEITQTGMADIDYGQAWWLISANPLPISFPGANFTGDFFTYPMPGGYTMIGNPYADREIHWDWVARDPRNASLNAAPILYHWDSAYGDYVGQTILSPFQSAWAYTEYSGNLFVDTQGSTISYAPAPSSSTSSMALHTSTFQQFVDVNQKSYLDAKARTSSGHPSANRVHALLSRGASSTTLASKHVSRFGKNPPPPPPAPGAGITVLSPNGGEHYSMGSSIPIRWKAIGVNPEGFEGGVNIFLYCVETDHIIPILKNLQSKEGVDWKITRRTLPNTYYIAVQSVLYPEIYDISNEAFLIE